MPLHDRPEDALASLFDHVTVARYDPVKVPLVHVGDALVVTRAIPRADRVPDEPLLPQGPAARVVHRVEQPGRVPGKRRFGTLAVLLNRRQVEQQIRLYQRPLPLEMKRDFLVRVLRHILNVEFGVELGVDFGRVFLVLCGVDDVDLDVFVVLFGALFVEAFGAEDFGAGVRRGPGAEEDVVFEVEGCDVCGFRGRC